MNIRLSHRRLLLIFLAMILAACGSDSVDVPAVPVGPAAAVDDDALRRGGADDGADWLSYGRSYDEHRFSPLDQINVDTVGSLGLAWSIELDTTRGLEATPLAHDGVLYTTGSWSVVYAIDARTGELLWTYDPQVPRAQVAWYVCCDVVNRGAALYRGKVYVGTLDGRLIALDAASGVPVWSVTTFEPGKACRCARIRSMSSGSSILAITRKRPPQRAAPEPLEANSRRPGFSVAMLPRKSAAGRSSTTYSVGPRASRRLHIQV